MKQHLDEMSELVKWAMLSLVSGEENKEKLDSIMQGNGYDIHVTINGIEFDFEKLMNHIQEQFDIEVNEKARSIAVSLGVNDFEIKDRLYELQHNLKLAQLHVDNAIESLSYGKEKEDNDN